MVEAKVPVTLRALVQRINRKLAHTEEVLKTARGQRAIADLGNYYILDWGSNLVSAWHVDPVKLAHELKVLAAWEYVEDAEG